MIAIIVEEDYKGSYRRFALTNSEFFALYSDYIDKDNMMPPEVDPHTHTLKPMTHIWYKIVEIGDCCWTTFFTDMTWGLTEMDEECGVKAYIDYESCYTLRPYVPRQNNIKTDGLSTDDCLEIFKTYDKDCYEYYSNNMQFFGCEAKNYATYLKNKYSSD